MSTGSLKPNLFIVGAPKCGTTAWVHYLTSHPSIFFSTPKEPHHFCYDFPRYRWFKSLDDYLKLFEEASATKVVGEASVFYLYSHQAARAIRDFNPDARIIILVRAQEEFLPSLHNQLLFNGDENIADFERAWRLSNRRDSSNSPAFCREIKFLNYEAAGHFTEQVERYYAEFPADQIRLFHFDDWTTHPRAIYAEMLAFLGIEDDGRTDFPKVNLAQQRRFRRLTPFLKRPPRILRQIHGLVKRLTGRAGFGAKLLALNSMSGYVDRTSDEIRAEIRQYYAADNAKLARYITRVTRPSDFETAG